MRCDDDAQTSPTTSAKRYGVGGGTNLTVKRGFRIVLVCFIF